MTTEQCLAYNAGQLFVTSIGACEESGEIQISVDDIALIGLYIRVLNEMGIVGDIEVSMDEIKEKHGSLLTALLENSEG